MNCYQRSHQNRLGPNHPKVLCLVCRLSKNQNFQSVWYLSVQTLAYKIAKEQSSENVASSTPSDIDKPGPSGLQQQQTDVSQPGPSDVEQQTGDTDKAGTSAAAELQQPSEDPDKPGPSGLQPADVPSTSGDAGVAMEVDGGRSAEGDEVQGQGDSNQLLATDVKVTGSSVWTPVQVKWLCTVKA